MEPGTEQPVQGEATTETPAEAPQTEATEGDQQEATIEAPAEEATEAPAEGETEGATEGAATETPASTSAGVSTEDTGPQVVVPVEIREMTRVETDKGKIHIIHEVTFGDLLISTFLVAILIFQVLSRFVRR
ncbi:hypothetical protein V4V35_25375 [Bacillus infantis]|uniref:hypothetical protein n=1 Tax=Bacillus infantis TaxID=324767 RepID=UPI002FBDA992